LARIKQNDGELIAGFGAVSLVKHLSGKFGLRGDTDADRADHREQPL
jgi:hypothetical protein